MNHYSKAELIKQIQLSMGESEVVADVLNGKMREGKWLMFSITGLDLFPMIEPRFNSDFIEEELVYKWKIASFKGIDEGWLIVLFIERNHKFTPTFYLVHEHHKFFSHLECLMEANKSNPNIHTF